MINSDYWKDFYKQNPKFEVSPTPFALWVTDFDRPALAEATPRTLADLGAGNCRDSIYFHRQGYVVTAIDGGMSPAEIVVPFGHYQADFLEFDLSGQDVIYLRFVIHAMTEADLDTLLHKLATLPNESTIYAETRSTTGISQNEKAETFFKSSIGSEHFRMLYSQAYLDEKFSRNFEIVISEESNEFAKYKGDNPYVLRYVLKKAAR